MSNPQQDKDLEHEDKTAKGQLESRATQDATDGCSCMAWQDSFVHLRPRATGVPLRYCPWCGSGLTSAPKRPEAAAVPSRDAMCGILAGYTRVGPESDAERMEWLEAQGVVSIYLRDGMQINPAGLGLRAVLDLVDRSRSSPDVDSALTKP